MFHRILTTNYRLAELFFPLTFQLIVVQLFDIKPHSEIIVVVSLHVNEALDSQTKWQYGVPPEAAEMRMEFYLVNFYSD